MNKRFYIRFAILSVVLLSIAGMSYARNIRVVNLENEVVRKFMSHGPYSGFGTEASYFDNSDEFPSRYAWDKPQAVEINWEGMPVTPTP